MPTRLKIVVNNPMPHRQKRYPRWWLLYREGQDPVEVQVQRDGNNTPRVVDKAAA